VSSRYVKEFSQYSPLREAAGLTPLLQRLVGLPTQIVLTPLEVDRGEHRAYFPMLAIEQNYADVMQRSGYLGFPFNIALAVASDLKLLRDAQASPIEIPWDAALEGAHRALLSLRCDTCRDFLSSSCPGSRSTFPAVGYVHGDLHLGNIVHDSAGLHVIDLENLHTAPPFTDLVMFLLEVAGYVRDVDHPRVLRDFTAAADCLASWLGVLMTPFDLAYGTGLFLMRATMAEAGRAIPEGLLCSVVDRYADNGAPHAAIT